MTSVCDDRPPPNHEATVQLRTEAAKPKSGLQSVAEGTAALLGTATGFTLGLLVGGCKNAVSSSCRGGPSITEEAHAPPSPSHVASEHTTPTSERPASKASSSGSAAIQPLPAGADALQAIHKLEKETQRKLLRPGQTIESTPPARRCVASPSSPWSQVSGRSSAASSRGRRAVGKPRSPQYDNQDVLSQLAEQQRSHKEALEEMHRQFLDQHLKMHKQLLASAVSAPVWESLRENVSDIGKALGRQAESCCEKPCEQLVVVSHDRKDQEHGDGKVNEHTRGTWHDKANGHATGAWLGERYDDDYDQPQTPTRRHKDDDTLPAIDEAVATAVEAITKTEARNDRDERTSAKTELEIHINGNNEADRAPQLQQQCPKSVNEAPKQQGNTMEEKSPAVEIDHESPNCIRKPFDNVPTMLQGKEEVEECHGQSRVAEAAEVDIQEKGYICGHGQEPPSNHLEYSTDEQSSSQGQPQHSNGSNLSHMKTASPICHTALDLSGVQCSNLQGNSFLASQEQPFHFQDELHAAVAPVQGPVNHSKLAPRSGQDSMMVASFGSVRKDSLVEAGDCNVGAPRAQGDVRHSRLTPRTSVGRPLLESNAAETGALSMVNVSTSSPRIPHDSIIMTEEGNAASPVAEGHVGHSRLTPRASVGRPMLESNAVEAHAQGVVNVSTSSPRTRKDFLMAADECNAASPRAAGQVGHSKLISRAFVGHSLLESNAAEPRAHGVVNVSILSPRMPKDSLVVVDERNAASVDSLVVVDESQVGHSRLTPRKVSPVVAGDCNAASPRAGGDLGPPWKGSPVALGDCNAASLRAEGDVGHSRLTPRKDSPVVVGDRNASPPRAEGDVGHSKLTPRKGSLVMKGDCNAPPLRAEGDVGHSKLTPRASVGRCMLESNAAESGAQSVVNVSTSSPRTEGQLGHSRLTPRASSGRPMLGSNTGEIRAQGMVNVSSSSLRMPSDSPVVADECNTTSPRAEGHVRHSKLTPRASVGHSMVQRHVSELRGHGVVNFSTSSPRMSKDSPVEASVGPNFAQGMVNVSTSSPRMAKDSPLVARFGRPQKESSIMAGNCNAATPRAVSHVGHSTLTPRKGNGSLIEASVGPLVLEATAADTRGHGRMNVSTSSPWRQKDSCPESPPPGNMFPDRDVSMSNIVDKPPSSLRVTPAILPSGAPPMTRSVSMSNLTDYVLTPTAIDHGGASPSRANYRRMTTHSVCESRLGDSAVVPTGAFFQEAASPSCSIGLQALAAYNAVASSEITKVSQVQQAVDRMARAVHTFQRYKKKNKPSDLVSPQQQPRKTWEVIFTMARGVILSLTSHRGDFPVAEWQNPTLTTIQEFFDGNNGMFITREICFAELLRVHPTGADVDEDLFIVACIVNLCRAGLAQNASDVKPNANIFDSCMEQLLSNGREGNSDELEPDGSKELLNDLKRKFKQHLRGMPDERRSFELKESDTKSETKADTEGKPDKKAEFTSGAAAEVMANNVAGQIELSDQSDNIPDVRCENSNIKSDTKSEDKTDIEGSCDGKANEKFDDGSDHLEVHVKGKSEVTTDLCIKPDKKPDTEDACDKKSDLGLSDDSSDNNKGHFTGAPQVNLGLEVLVSEVMLDNVDGRAHEFGTTLDERSAIEGQCDKSDTKSDNQADIEGACEINSYIYPDNLSHKKSDDASHDLEIQVNCKAQVTPGLDYIASDVMTDNIKGPIPQPTAAEVIQNVVIAVLAGQAGGLATAAAESPAEVTKRGLDPVLPPGASPYVEAKHVTEAHVDTSPSGSDKLAWAKKMIADDNARHELCDREFAAADHNQNGSLDLNEVVEVVFKICTEMSIRLPSVEKIAALVRKVHHEEEDASPSASMPEMKPIAFRTIIKTVLKSVVHEAENQARRAMLQEYVVHEAENQDNRAKFRAAESDITDDVVLQGRTAMAQMKAEEPENKPNEEESRRKIAEDKLTEDKKAQEKDDGRIQALEETLSCLEALSCLEEPRGTSHVARGQQESSLSRQNSLTGSHHEDYLPEPQLLHVYRKNKKTMVIEVPLERQSMTQGDCYILLDGKTIYTWKGEESTPFEQNMAAMQAENIARDRHGHVAEPDARFWYLLGGEGYIRRGEASESGGSDMMTATNTPSNDRTRSEAILAEPQLLHIRRQDSKNVVQEVRLSRESMRQNACYVLVDGRRIYIWLGEDSKSFDQNACAMHAENIARTRLGKVRTEVDARFWELLGGEGPIRR